MKRFPLLLVAALIGVAVSAPAQRTSNSRQSRGAVATSQQSQRGQIVNRAAPSRSARSTNSARSATSRGRASSSRSTRPVARTTPVRSARSSQIGYVGHNGQGTRSRTVARFARNVARVARSIPVPIHVGFGHNNHSYNRGHGHWITRCEQVLVPGYWDVDYHAAVYGSCGYRVWGVSEPAYNHRVWVPARYETRTRQVWVRH